MEDRPVPGPGPAARAGNAAEVAPELVSAVDTQVEAQVDTQVDVLAVIERAVESVRLIGEAPLDEHAERYKGLHSTLQAALSDTDLRDSG
ncbi:MAG: hypothetical protein JWM76_5231 [Pseudonocardiales bacterium]|nr:hypothetical protein [Pseudonocardiales bacterium]